MWPFPIFQPSMPSPPAPLLVVPSELTTLMQRHDAERSVNPQSVMNRVVYDSLNPSPYHRPVGSPEASTTSDTPAPNETATPFNSGDWSGTHQEFNTGDGDKDRIRAPSSALGCSAADSDFDSSGSDSDDSTDPPTRGGGRGPRQQEAHHSSEAKAVKAPSHARAPRAQRRAWRKAGVPRYIPNVSHAVGSAGWTAGTVGIPFGASPPTVLPPWYIPESPHDSTLVFESRFETGNLRRAIQVYEFEYDLILKPDVNTKGHTQWYYFSVRTRGGA